MARLRPGLCGTVFTPCPLQFCDPQPGPYLSPVRDMMGQSYEAAAEEEQVQERGTCGTARCLVCSWIGQQKGRGSEWHCASGTVGVGGVQAKPEGMALGARGRAGQPIAALPPLPHSPFRQSVPSNPGAGTREQAPPHPPTSPNRCVPWPFFPALVLSLLLPRPWPLFLLPPPVPLSTSSLSNPKSPVPLPLL